TLSDMSPEVRRVRAVTNPVLARTNPVARAFLGYAMSFFDVRTVEPLRIAPNRPEGARYTAESLLLVPDGDVWAESNVTADPSQLVGELLRSKQVGDKLSPDPLPIAVAVTEPVQPADPSDPHAFMRAQEQRPRLVAFGDATFVT